MNADEFSHKLRSLLAEALNQPMIPLDAMIVEVGVAHHRLIQTKVNIEAAQQAKATASAIVKPNGSPMVPPRRGFPPSGISIKG